MPKIVISIPTKSEPLRRVEALPGVQVTATKVIGDIAEPLPREVIADADILVCKVPPTNYEDMQALKFVQITSVGFTQLNPLQLPQRGARACNARGVYDTAIAEWTVAMMINLGRDLRGMIRNQEQGLWDRGERYCTEIRGQTLGIWGYGGIGRETARLAKMLGLTVHVMARRDIGRRDDSYVVAGTGDPDGKLPDRVFKPGQEAEFLGGIDFLVLAMPLSAANTGIIGERELRAMKRSAYLLNPARGPLVQEQPLLRALSEGWIAGAALDTHYHYPMPPDHPLWRMPNVIMTPHVSGADKGPYFLDRMWEIVEHNLTSFVTGGPLWNEIAPEELK
jgi:phosphoglycerate dehydrogenase-like enzyme